jgi:SAM-dependent methyltransferase
MNYENRVYWEQLHHLYAGRLRAVGHPQLSERLNRLKYQSESNAFLAALTDLVPALPKRSPLRILDIGAGTGYWTELTHRQLQDHGVKTELVALDMSASALELLRQQCPWVRTVQEDLRTVDPSRYAAAYDVTTACYCLHHIVKADDFLNGLRFAAGSVAPGGFLLLMDPILTRPYSPFAALNPASFRGNGLPRSQPFLDDHLRSWGLDRQSRRAAVSFLLNGPIEGQSRLCYTLCAVLWRAIQLPGRYELATRPIARLLGRADRVLKRVGWDFSASLCVYRKRPAADAG